MTSMERQTEQAVNANKVPIECPKCQHKTEQTIGWIRTHTEMTCAGCAATIDLDKAGLEKGIQSALAEARKLDRQLAKGFKFTLKL